MEKQGWKITAILSTILLILALIALCCIFYMGAMGEYKEQVCAYDICGLDNSSHDSYFLAPDDSCFCFNDGQLDFIEDVNDFTSFIR